MKKVAIIGTQGVPAQYGGFETLVENLLGKNCPEDVEYTVFCSSRDYKEIRSEYKEAHLKYVPLRANGTQSIPYDMWSLTKVLGKEYDAVLVLGVSGCTMLPLFRAFYRGRIIVNIDGLEHRRDKWGGFARWFLRASEAAAVRAADIVVADNQGIADYVKETYGLQPRVIAYGGDHVVRKVDRKQQHRILTDMGLISGKYALSVCRIEPENNCHVTLEAFARSNRTFVFVGNWERSAYGRELKVHYADRPNLICCDPIYDLDVLYALRRHCSLYVHGHSAGGTNPSLVEAMHFGIPVFAFNVVYNRATTANRAHYFASAEELQQLLEFTDADSLQLNAEAMLELANKEYTWTHIAEQYAACYE
ncbi:DUF1972 domain-containing protein [Akkermansia sp. N21169]|uniref:DUF1972 domain-containing protein n=1 Tax=Akkermansia sp. N21169 TaxID=3040765 RepID=UPI00244E6E59|nr:DUF1972 domain-containing protein [Akkermansia sp. N21169]MDH3069546.1 DUF1972 domain-containing protein [Akkermansia sp. N21169]